VSAILPLTGQSPDRYRLTEPMRILLFALGVTLTLAPALGGCGGIHYAINISAADSRLEEARAVGAEQLAPYEYYYAKEHLEQAQVEAAQASYSDAANLADEAEQYASKAIELAQSARRERP
jgi:hypothetical protein